MREDIGEASGGKQKGEGYKREIQKNFEPIKTAVEESRWKLLELVNSGVNEC